MADAQEKNIDVKDWPNLNIDKWRKWGFTVDRVLRTSKYHFIFQRAASAFKIFEGEEFSLKIEGKFYRIDDDMEKKLEKMSWVAYALIILMFATLIRSVMLNSGFMAALSFLLMYSTIEGFQPYTLMRVTSDIYDTSIDIPWSKITRLTHVVKNSVLMIGWNDGDNDLGVAVELHPLKSKEVYELLTGGIDKNVQCEVVEGIGLGSPVG